LFANSLAVSNGITEAGTAGLLVFTI